MNRMTALIAATTFAAGTLLGFLAGGRAQPIEPAASPTAVAEAAPAAPAAPPAPEAPAVEAPAPIQRAPASAPPAAAVSGTQDAVRNVGLPYGS